MPKLTSEQIKKQRQELYNYRNVLYPQLKTRSHRLRSENKELKQENEVLKKDQVKLGKTVEKLLLEIEELKEIAYGKKRCKREQTKITVITDKEKLSEKETKKTRSKGSYRRAVPDESEVTDTVSFDLPTCPDCEGELTARRDHTHYREDIAELDALRKQARKLVKRIHQSGYCKVCKKRQHALPLEKFQLGQTVSFGQNVRAMTVYLNILMGLSHQETIDHLFITFGIQVSAGEITNILQSQADLLNPAYQQIYQELQQEPACHYDETSWKVQGESEGNYAWVKTATTSEKLILWLGKSRGKGVAEKLKGEPPDTQVLISDDYPGYLNLYPEGKHQLCWAHPYRKIRDLAESNKLSQVKLKHCQKVFKRFEKLYAEVDAAKKQFDLGHPPTDAQIQKFTAEFLEIMKSHKHDPEKLCAIKKSLTERHNRYFICLKIPGIPLDNNKAERAIRKLVLKRKKSFGSKTQKGADMLSILYSVVFSIARSHPLDSFFENYDRVIKNGGM